MAVSKALDYETDVLDGRNAQLAVDVHRALGREPRDVADDARDNAAAGVWSGSPVAG